MTIKIITDQSVNEQRAKEFFAHIDEVMNRQGFPINVLAFAVIDKIYDLVSNVDTGVGYVVSNSPENGIVSTDLFNGCSYEEYAGVINDVYKYTSADVSFFDIESSRKTFLFILGQQVLSNLPNTWPEAVLHVKRNVASLFNGFNFYKVRFELVYLDHNLMDEEYYSTPDLGDLLVV